MSTDTQNCAFLYKWIVHSNCMSPMKLPDKLYLKANIM